MREGSNPKKTVLLQDKAKTNKKNRILQYAAP